MAANEADQKLSRNALIALVIGSMVGSGIFALPAQFGRTTGAIIAWVIAGTGMLTLAFVFQSLSRRKPELDAGIYAYAKDGAENSPAVRNPLRAGNAAVPDRQARAQGEAVQAGRVRAVRRDRDRRGRRDLWAGCRSHLDLTDCR